MQSSGGLSGVNQSRLINGFLMSFLAALRSLTEQVAGRLRLMIKPSVPFLKNRLMFGV
ncbi:hypothetical protein [Pseudomonas viridiflava]